MTIRVNMSYSVKLDELGEEVNRLLNNTLSSLEDILVENNQIGYKEEEPLTLQTLRDVDAMRRDLSDIDIALADISGIITSYIEYENSKIGKPTPTQNVDDIQTRLEEAKEALNAVRSNEDTP